MRVDGVTIEKIETIDATRVAVFYRTAFGNLVRREAWAAFAEISGGLEARFYWGANQPINVVEQKPEGAR